MKHGAALRRAQVSSLKGRSADVRQATEAHREAVALAVKEATRLAANDGVQVNPDALARTVEALSLAERTPEPAGRLTSPLQAAGFEALAGVAIAASSHGRAETSTSSVHQAERRSAKADEERARQAARVERARASAIQKAERALDRARTARGGGAPSVESREGRSRQGGARPYAHFQPYGDPRPSRVRVGSHTVGLEHNSERPRTKSPVPWDSSSRCASASFCLLGGTSVARRSPNGQVRCKRGRVFQSVGETFFYVTTEAQRLASLSLDALGDVPTRSWVIIGAATLVTLLLFSKRPGR